MSALPMLMVIAGGGATLWGPCLGAAVIVLANHYAAVYAQERWELILGAIFVLCVLFLKGGFAPYLSSLWEKVRWPGSRKAVGERAASSEAES
jgi:branched-chain amino acid transport system permease protein